MKTKFIPSILIFISAYSPLAIVFAIQDFCFKTKKFNHPIIIVIMFIIAILSCTLTIISVKCIKTSSPKVKVLKLSNRSDSLVNYCVPYMLSFFAVDLSNINQVMSFIFFMILMYIMTMKTSNLFLNPILLILGYKLFEVEYEDNNIRYSENFLVSGNQMQIGNDVRIVKITDTLNLVTDINPE